MSKKANAEHPYDYNCNCYQCYETWQYRQELPCPGPATIERDFEGSAHSHAPRPKQVLTHRCGLSGRGSEKKHN